MMRKHIVNIIKQTEMINKMYVLMDAGYSESFASLAEANKACEELSRKHCNWHDGGQPTPYVFEVDLINKQ